MVSIIIPVYNVASYLERCIESCLKQSFSDIEILAINDGSGDISGEILDKYALKDSRLRVFHQKNKGVVLARDKGIFEAKGEWLMFVDGDDYIAVNAVETLLSSVLNSKSEIAVGGFFIERGNRKIRQLNTLPFGNNPKDLACALLSEKMQFSLWGKILKRSLFEGLKIPSNLKIGEDAFAIIQLLDKGPTIALNPTPVYYYVQRKGSVMNNPSNLAIQSRMLFVESVTEFYKEKEYFTDTKFQAFFGRWLLNEYFGFLRMGGKVKEFNLAMVTVINEKYLNNKESTSFLPLWRIFFLKAYRSSQFNGNCFRTIFNFTRKLVRSIES